MKRILKALLWSLSAILIIALFPVLIFIICKFIGELTALLAIGFIFVIGMFAWTYYLQPWEK